MNNKREKKYEIRVAIGLFLIIFMVTSGLKCISVMLTEVAALGFSMAFIGICTSLCGFISIASSILFGKIVKKISIKNMILIAAVFSSVSYLMLVNSTNGVILVVSFILKGIALTFSGYTPSAVLLARWFREKYAFALAIVFSAMSAGTAFWSLMYGIAQPIFGFANTIYVFAALQIIIPLLVLKFLVIEHPEDVGVVPFAKEHNSEGETNKKNKKQKQISVLNVNSKTALKTPLCWHIILVALFVSGGILIIQSYLPMQAEIMGFNKTQSASTFSIIMVLGAISGILGGIYASKKSAYHYYAFITCSFLVGWFVMMTFDLTYPMLVLVAMLCGVAYPVISTAVSLVLKENFGQEAYTGVLGILNAFNLIGGSIMSPLAGLTYDNTGSYMSAYLWLGGLVLLGLIAMAFYPILRKKAFKKHSEFMG